MKSIFTIAILSDIVETTDQVTQRGKPFSRKSTKFPVYHHISLQRKAKNNRDILSIVIQFCIVNTIYSIRDENIKQSYSVKIHIHEINWNNSQIWSWCQVRSFLDLVILRNKVRKKIYSRKIQRMVLPWCDTFARWVFLKSYTAWTLQKKDLGAIVKRTATRISFGS